MKQKNDEKAKEQKESLEKEVEKPNDEETKEQKED